MANSGFEGTPKCIMVVTVEASLCFHRGFMRFLFMSINKSCARICFIMRASHYSVREVSDVELMKVVNSTDDSDWAIVNCLDAKKKKLVYLLTEAFCPSHLPSCVKSYRFPVRMNDVIPFLELLKWFGS